MGGRNAGIKGYSGEEGERDEGRAGGEVGKTNQTEIHMNTPYVVQDLYCFCTTNKKIKG